MKAKVKAIFLFQLICLSACSDLIEFSPYDTAIKTVNINVINVARITDKQLSFFDTVRFALFSDVHEKYDEMSDAISSINRLSGLNFVVCCGDITLQGLTQEFRWYLDIVEKSGYPLITAIGNHDYLLNGLTVFKRLFGPANMSFILGRYKFVIFDNTIWEAYNNSPKYEWLRDELSDNSYHNIIISHIPPFADDIDDLHRIIYDQIVDSTNTILTVHGHIPRFSDTFYNGIHTVVTNPIEKREYYIITLIRDIAFVKRLSF